MNLFVKKNYQFLILTLLSSFLFYSCETEEISPMVEVDVENVDYDEVQSRADKETKITIKFGRKKKDCFGFGICVITTTTTSLNPGVEGEGDASNDNGSLVLDLSIESMVEQVYEEHFGSGIFTMEEELVLSDELTSELGLEEGYTLQAGQYEVIEEGENVRLHF